MVLKQTGFSNQVQRDGYQRHSQRTLGSFTLHTMINDIFGTDLEQVRLHSRQIAGRRRNCANRTKGRWKGSKVLVLHINLREHSPEVAAVGTCVELGEHV